ncbi:32702_t:CDS:2, partial [Racocetra persica]
ESISTRASSIPLAIGSTDSTTQPLVACMVGALSLVALEEPKRSCPRGDEALIGTPAKALTTVESSNSRMKRLTQERTDNAQRPEGNRLEVLDDTIMSKGSSFHHQRITKPNETPGLLKHGRYLLDNLAHLGHHREDRSPQNTNMDLQSLQADTEYRITVVKSSTSLEYGGDRRQTRDRRSTAPGCSLHPNKETIGTSLTSLGMLLNSNLGIYVSHHKTETVK